MTYAGFDIRPILAKDKAWVECTLNEHWGSTRMVSRGVLHDIAAQDGFIAARDGSGIRIGLATYAIRGAIQGGECEMTLLQSLAERAGVGAALTIAVRDAAIAAGCGRLWLVTTNDNTRALRFYQRRGFTIAAIHINALEQARKLKPGIPLTGADGIPLRDEIELEMRL